MKASVEFQSLGKHVVLRFRHAHIFKCVPSLSAYGAQINADKLTGFMEVNTMIRNETVCLKIDRQQYMPTGGRQTVTIPLFPSPHHLLNPAHIPPFPNTKL